jgi:hypothetical protein
VAGYKADVNIGNAAPVLVAGLSISVLARFVLPSSISSPRTL